jgi:signal transduction histidine kinase
MQGARSDPSASATGDGASREVALSFTRTLARRHDVVNVKPIDVAVATAALVAGVAVSAAVFTSDSADHAVRTGALTLVIGLSWVGAGLVALHRRPENRTGLIMVATGFLWFLAQLGYADNHRLNTVGTATELLFILGFAYLLLSFPDGRLHSRFERVLMGIGFIVGAVLQLAWILFDGDPENLLAVTDSPDAEMAIENVQRALGAAVSVATAIVVVRRWRRASAPLRRAAEPVLWAGAASFVALAVSAVNDIVDQPLGDVEWLWWLVFATVPFAFLAGLLRVQMARSAVAQLVLELGQAPEPGHVRDALARALGDPELRLAYWVPERKGFVDAAGRPVELSADATVVERGGRRIAALEHDPALAEQQELLESVGAAAALALENERLNAELRARLEDLRASRARIVEAAEAERRRVERNLHDGAQQRLVSIAMQLGLMERKLKTDPEAAKPILHEAREDLAIALQELRELSQGIHPSLLTERGLEAALGELPLRTPVPLELEFSIEERLPAQVEAAAYYVVSEALANVTKYAQATAVRVRVDRVDGKAVVEVADDGVGGADSSRGSGLSGLTDRVEALGGRLALVSPVGRGTIVRAEIPCG